MAGRSELLVPHSKMKMALAKILKDFNYIEDFKLVEEGVFKQIKITLKYIGKTAAISGVKRISKPGRRIYKGSVMIPRTLNGYGLTIVSTNQGLMDSKSGIKVRTIKKKSKQECLKYERFIRFTFAVPKLIRRVKR